MTAAKRGVTVWRRGSDPRAIRIFSGDFAWKADTPHDALCGSIVAIAQNDDGVDIFLSEGPEAESAEERERRLAATPLRPAIEPLLWELFGNVGRALDQFIEIGRLSVVDPKVVGAILHDLTVTMAAKAEKLTKAGAGSR